ncbi:uncharacterized protein LOC106061530 [Biomphalaria glabrata]|uniref:Uncharacterized protein LOC106061530 n=1 Tax=Biomphalaria glabrata TaxID=6526 RepID=A0A9U8E7N3_BIOGL|nr:uncharacterized protein LOC106061530 [Biomphalaria glabrata]
MFYFALFFLGSVIVRIICEDAEVNCGTKWFGPKCQFMCQCQDGCDTQGQCLGTKECNEDWIEHACQYRSIPFITETFGINNVGSPASSILQDEDDSTCLNDDEIRSVKILMFPKIVFLWIRLVVDNADLVDKITVHGEDTSDVLTKEFDCLRQQFTIVNNKTVYIRCDMNGAVNSIILKGEGLTSLCTIQINLGRNFALRQRTEQTTTVVNNFASKAVDGDWSGDVTRGSCTETNNVIDFTPTWFLTLDEEIAVNIIAIILPDKSTSMSRDLLNYKILALDKYDSLILDMMLENTDFIVNIYKALIKKVIIQAKNKTSTMASLSLCEVLVLGECPPGKWGLDCKKDCNDHCPENCNEIDGSCPTQTSCLGYFPPKCTQVCPPNKWGVKCRENCPGACAYSYCNNSYGHCTAGCNGYSDPPFCTEACLPGYYGLNCRSYASPQNKESENNQCEILSLDELQSRCVHGSDKFVFSVSNFFIGLGTGVAAALIIVTLVIIVRKCCLKRRPLPMTTDDGYEDISAENVTNVSKTSTHTGINCSNSRTADEPVKRNMASYDEIDVKRHGDRPGEYSRAVEAIQEQ